MSERTYARCWLGAGTAAGSELLERLGAARHATEACWVSARTHARTRAAGALRELAAGAGRALAAGAGRERALASCSWSPVTSGPKSPTKSVALSRAQRTFKGRAGEAPGKVFRSSAALALAAASVPYMVTKPKPRETFPSSTKTSPSTTWPYCANSAVRSPDANDSGSPSTKSVVFRRTRTAAAAAWTEVARDIGRARARVSSRARAGVSVSRASLPLAGLPPAGPARTGYSKLGFVPKFTLPKLCGARRGWVARPPFPFPLTHTHLFSTT